MHNFMSLHALPLALKLYMEKFTRGGFLRQVKSDFSSIHDKSPQTCRPYSWEWDCSMILRYIKMREANFVQDHRNPENMRTLVSAVVRMIIYPCFDKKRACIIENRNAFLRALTGKKRTRRRVYVEYFAGSSKVPIHNIYSALGWLISVTDPPPAMSPSSLYQEALSCYARLCQTLSLRIGTHTRPMSVHLLLIASPLSIPGSGFSGALFGTGDLCAALATFQCNVPRVQITVTDDAGVSSVVEKGPHSRHPEVLAADLYTLKRQRIRDSKGGSEETLEFLLQLKSDAWYTLWGLSCSLDKLNSRFAERRAPMRIPESETKACRLFLNGFNATFVDATHSLRDDWRHSVVCQSCRTVVSCSPRDIAQPRFSECTYGCGAIWCAGCRQEEDSKHTVNCPSRLKIMNSQREALRELQRTEENLQPTINNSGEECTEFAKQRGSTIATPNTDPPSIQAIPVDAPAVLTQNPNEQNARRRVLSKAPLGWRRLVSTL